MAKDRKAKQDLKTNYQNNEQNIYVFGFDFLIFAFGYMVFDYGYLVFGYGDLYYLTYMVY